MDIDIINTIEAGEPLDNIELGLPENFGEGATTEEVEEMTSTLPEVTCTPLPDVSVVVTAVLSLIPKDCPNTDKALKDLKSGNGAIPGLDVDTIVKSITEKSKVITTILKPYQDVIDDANKILAGDNEDLKAKAQTLKDQAIAQLKTQKDTMTQQIKDTVTEVVDEVQQQYNKVKSDISGINTAVTSFIANQAIPSTIVTGSAVGVANPISFLNSAKALKAQLSMSMATTKTTLTNLLKNCQKIGYNIPSIIVTLVDGVKALDTIISKLPG